MKLLIVINDFYLKSNGLCISTQRFYEEYKKMGIEVKILSGNVHGQPDFPLKPAKLPLVQPLIDKQGYIFAKAEKNVIEEAVKWCDIVHLEEPFVLQFITAKIAKKYNKIIVGSFHLFPENMLSSVHLGKSKALNLCGMKVFKIATYKYCEFIHCPTEIVEARLKKYKYKGYTKIISNGIPEERILKRKEKPLEIRDRFLILSVGRYSVEKDQITLIKAVENSKYRDKIQIILAGQGPLKEKYEKEALSLPLPPRFEFFSKEQLMDVTSYSDLIIHTADVEVEGMSLMEGFAGGCVPIIAKSKLSATSQYGLEERNLFNAHDYLELAKKIDFYVENKKILKADSEKYQEYAKTLTVSKCARKMVDEYECLLNKRK